VVSAPHGSIDLGAGRGLANAVWTDAERPGDTGECRNDAGSRSSADHSSGGAGLAFGHIQYAASISGRPGVAGTFQHWRSCAAIRGNPGGRDLPAATVPPARRRDPEAAGVDIARRSRVAQRSLTAGEKAVATSLSVRTPVDPPLACVACACQRFALASSPTKNASTFAFPRC